MLPIALLVLFGIAAFATQRMPARSILGPVVGAVAFVVFAASALLSADTRRVDLFFAFLAVLFLVREWQNRSKKARA